MPNKTRHGSPTGFHARPSRSKRWSVPLVASQVLAVETMSCRAPSKSPANAETARHHSKNPAAQSVRALPRSGAPGRVGLVPRLSRILSVLSIIIATFVAYTPAMRNSFVWDDTALVLRDPLIRHWRLAPQAVGEFLFFDASPANFYRPMQRLTYVADYAFWGIARPAQKGPAKTGAPDTGDGADLHAVETAPQPGWHFSSVFWHALAAVALWRLLQQWLGKNGDAWALGVALLWALHPLHTSAVTYVSGRADSLAACFAFSALYFVAKAHQRGRLEPQDRAAARQAIAAMVCGFFALLSKESGVAAFSLWLVWVLFKARGDRRGWVTFAMAVIIAVGGYLSLRLTAGQAPVPPKETSVSLLQRGQYVTRALAEYATLFVAPHDLHMERDIREKPGDTRAVIRFRHWQTAGGVAIILGLILWARWAGRRAPDAALALAAFAVTWLPVSNLFTLNATVAEHWLYVPSAFILAAVAFSLRALLPHPRVLVPVAAAWGLMLGYGTFSQQGYWRNQQTFFETTAARAGAGPRMLVQLGGLAFSEALYGGGRQALAASPEAQTEEALRYTREALRLDPTLAVAHLNLAKFAMHRKDYATARAELAEAEKSPLFAAAGIMMRAQISQAETGKPNLPMLADAASRELRNWGICRMLPEAYMQLGKPQQAIEEILRFNTEHPFRAEAWRLLGRAAEQAGNFEMAARAYGEAANRDLRDEVSRGRLRELRAKQ